MQPLPRLFALGILVISLVLAPTSARAQAEPTSTTLAAVEAAIAQIETRAQSEIDEGVAVGMAIAVVYQDELVYAHGFGVRDIDTGEAVDADTVFQLASLSKPLGSTVVAALVGDGVVTWDSRISDLDPAFAMYDPWVTREITLRDLYAHRSGLPGHAGDLLEDLGYTRSEILHRLREQPPSSSFRSEYAYTNFGMAEAAFAAARATGQSWEAVSEERLYGPLGMESTSSRYADLVAQPNRALLHVREEGQWVQKFERENDSSTPAGGASSSVNDMAQWMRLQLRGGLHDGEQIIDAGALDETHHPHMLTGFNPFTGLPGFYGLGWSVGYDPQGRLRLSHSGAFALGAATSVMLVPDEELGIITLTNSYPVGMAEGLNQTFIDLALYGETTADWLTLYKQRFADPAALGIVPSMDYSAPPVSPSPALAPEAYVGVYANDYFGKMEIEAIDGELGLIMGPQPTRFPLQHYDRDTFSYMPTGENAAGPSGVTLTIGPVGTAISVLVEHLDVRGQGRFQRVEEPAP